MKILCIILLLLFSCEKNQNIIPASRMETIETDLDGIAIILNDYQISSNLIAIQLKITNNSENIIFIPDSVTTDYKLLDNKLTITEYYSYAHRRWRPSDISYSRSFIIEPNEINFYSVLLRNTSLVRGEVKDTYIDREGKIINIIETRNSFIDLEGIKIINLTIGLYIDLQKNYSTNDYREYNFFNISDKLQMITLEGIINDDKEVNNKIGYKYLENHRPHLVYR